MRNRQPAQGRQTQVDRGRAETAHGTQVGAPLAHLLVGEQGRLRRFAVAAGVPDRKFCQGSGITLAGIVAVLGYDEGIDLVLEHGQIPPEKIVRRS
jgi:hypothetical protein